MLLCEILGLWRVYRSLSQPYRGLSKVYRGFSLPLSLPYRCPIVAPSGGCFVACIADPRLPLQENDMNTSPSCSMRTLFLLVVGRP